MSLADARRARDEWAAVLRDGADPIEARDRLRREEADRANRSDPSFADMVAKVFENRAERLRRDSARDRWISPLKIHLLPKIGHMRLSRIHQADIERALKPIWKTKHETARKALMRTRIVFEEARLMGFECDVFTVDAAKHMLGHHAHVETPIVATAWQGVPDLFARLGGSASHLALKWVILTGMRSSAVRGARHGEIEGDVWTVPADRMKGRRGKVRDFRVPQSSAALEVLDACRAWRASDYLFPGRSRGLVSDWPCRRC